MGVERMADNNNVISSSNMKARATFNPSSSPSSPSSRPRRTRLTSASSQGVAVISQGGGMIVSTGPKTTVVATSVAATHEGSPVGDGEVVRRIPTAGFKRHSLLSGDTRLLSASSVSKATTPGRKPSRDSDKMMSPTAASNRTLVRKWSSTDVFTTSPSNSTREKALSRSTVAARKMSNSSEKRKSLTSGGSTAGDVGSCRDVTRQVETQGRPRPEPVGRSGTATRQGGHNTPNTNYGKPEPSSLPCSPARQSGATRTPTPASFTRLGPARGGGVRVTTPGGVVNKVPTTPKHSTVSFTSTTSAGSTKVTSNTSSMGTNVTISTKISTSITPVTRRYHSISSSVHTQTGEWEASPGSDR
ncbi:mucin-21 [Cherax quadricarinatus]|uniref:mucin-21 n=1 Tax=Cherax quadricarinatus TaxID=27406 RepID=UPI00387E40FE